MTWMPAYAGMTLNLTALPILLCCAILAQGLAAGAAGANERLAVVAGPASHLGLLTREQVAAAFLGEKRMIGEGQQVTTFDLDDEDIKQVFYAQVAHRSLLQIRAYWAKMVFTGNGRPPKSLPPDMLVRTLRADPNAIGYLPSNRAAGLKVLFTLPTE